MFRERKPRFPLRPLRAAALLVAVTALAQQNWDPPAITVFPDHNAAAQTPSLRFTTIEQGRILFQTRFSLADGAGRPAATGDGKPTFRVSSHDRGFTRVSGPEANSCAGCHNQPSLGGSGDFAANVFVGAQLRDPPTSSIDTGETSERNTLCIFGDGAIEMLAREMTRDLQQQKSDAIARARATGQEYTVALMSKSIPFGVLIGRPDGTYNAIGVEGVDPDLVIKPFGFKGAVISLREFTINALNQHHGMEAIERFGWERTGRRDFDGDGVEVEFTIGQTSALTLFQASLPPPGQAEPSNAAQAVHIRNGAEIFSRVGCALCHVPNLRLESTEFTEPSPYNRSGNILPEDVVGPLRISLPIGNRRGGITTARGGSLLVHAYTDLKRHRICDTEDPFFCNEKLRQDNIPVDEFLTPKLWDLATSAPYGHRGDCTTLSEAIRHHSAEAAAQRKAFLALPDSQKRELIAFLLSLGSVEPKASHGFATRGTSGSAQRR